jgi:hypothetical protein
MEKGDYCKFVIVLLPQIWLHIVPLFDLRPRMPYQKKYKYIMERKIKRKIKGDCHGVI